MHFPFEVSPTLPDPTATDPGYYMSASGAYLGYYSASSTSTGTALDVAQDQYHGGNGTSGNCPLKSCSDHTAYSRTACPQYSETFSKEKTQATLLGKEFMEPETQMIKEKPKKIRKPRTIYSSFQLAALQQRFQNTQYLALPERASLAASLGLTQTEVKIWFQNKRSKLKKIMKNSELPPEQNRSTSEPVTHDPCISSDSPTVWDSQCPPEPQDSHLHQQHSATASSILREDSSGFWYSGDATSQPQNPISIHQAMVLGAGVI